MRTMAIFEFFAERQSPARLSEIATGLQLPISSTEALLKTLVVAGYINTDARTRLYVPSSRLQRLGNWIDAGGFEATVAHEAMYRLRASTGLSVVLAAPDGLYLNYVGSAPVLYGDALRIATGTRRLLIQTGTGWLILSRRERGEAMAVYAETIAARLLDSASFTQEEYMARLEQHRDLSVSVLLASELAAPTGHWNACMVSALIPVPDGHRPLALGIYGEAGTMASRTEALAAALQAEIAHIAAHPLAGP